MNPPDDRANRIPEAFCPSLRKDLNWISYSANHRWVLHDPISNAFFYFNDIERRTAQLLDGSRSVKQVVESMSLLSGSVASPLPWVESLTQRLHASGLLMPTGQATRSKAQGKPWKQFLMQLAMNPLAIRIPIFRPSGFTRLAQYAGAILFHPWLALLGCIALGLVSFLLLSRWLSQPERLFFDVFRLQGDRWLLLFMMLIGIKTLHELGHYLACARWKVDCPELGLMLLCFSPCLYCDTTNAWKLKSRFQRAAISAGGIYVELWLAILGGLVFLNSDHDLWKTLGAGAWITCTVGTLLLNGNPCFRYDGYYILSDLWGVPNLGPQSQSALWQTMVYWLGGKPPQRPAFDLPVWQLGLFALISSVYRCLVLVLLISLVWTFLVPAGFGILAILIIGSLCLSLLFAHLRFAQGLFIESLGPTPIHPTRVAALCAMFAALGWVVWYVPIPAYIQARSYVQPETRQPLFMQDTASLVAAPHRSGPISPGDIILDTHSFERRKEWMDLKQRLEEVRIRIPLLENAKVNNEEAEFELPTLREALEDLEARFAIKQQEIDSLRMVATQDRTLVPVSIPLMMPFQLGETTWAHRTLFDNPPIGASLERGTLVGWLTTDDGYHFQASVPETDVRWLSTGSSAEAILDSEPHIRWPCTVSRISPEPQRELPPPLLGDPSLPTIRDERGKMQLESPHYLVILKPTIPIDRELPIHAAATIHFEIPGKTISEWISDAIRQGLSLP